MESTPLLAEETQTTSARRPSLQGQDPQLLGSASKVDHHGFIALMLTMFGLTLAVCAVTFVLIGRHYTGENGLRSLTFRDFGMHPLLMVCAFGFASPLATVSYQTFKLCGIKRTAAKALHAALQTASLACAVAGAVSIYLTRRDLGMSHLSTAHSWSVTIVELWIHASSGCLCNCSFTSTS